jgi:hypothetical protein
MMYFMKSEKFERRMLPQLRWESREMHFSVKRMLWQNYGLKWTKKKKKTLMVVVSKDVGSCHDWKSCRRLNEESHNFTLLIGASKSSLLLTKSFVPILELLPAYRHLETKSEQRGGRPSRSKQGEALRVGASEDSVFPLYLAGWERGSHTGWFSASKWGNHSSCSIFEPPEKAEPIEIRDRSGSIILSRFWEGGDY